MATTNTNLLASQDGSTLLQRLPLLRGDCTLYKLPPEIRIIIINMVLEAYYDWDRSIRDPSPNTVISLDRLPYFERAVIPCRNLFREVMSTRLKSSTVTFMPNRIRHFLNAINHTFVFGYQYPTVDNMAPLAIRSIRKVSLHTRNGKGGGPDFEDTFNSMARLLSKDIASLPILTHLEIEFVGELKPGHLQIAHWYLLDSGGLRKCQQLQSLRLVGSASSGVFPTGVAKFGPLGNGINKGLDKAGLFSMRYSRGYDLTMEWRLENGSFVWFDIEDGEGVESDIMFRRKRRTIDAS